MPGSWEIRERRKVLAYTLHTDTTTVAWGFGLRNLQIPGDMIALAGMPFDHARNTAAQECLRRGYEWLFSLDSDVIPPNAAILRLLQHRLPIVSGLYHRRSPPCSVPVMMMNGTWLVDYERGSLIEVEFVGAGCLLVHRSVVERFFQNPQRPGYPMFDWRVNMQGVLPPGECLSEDYTMSKYAREKFGIKTKVDTSIRRRHVDYSEYDDGSIAPLNCNPIT